MMASLTAPQADTAPDFDAAEWLASYQQAGGGYALTPTGSLIFLTATIDRLSLAMAFRQIINWPARLAAVRAAIIAKGA